MKLLIWILGSMLAAGIAILPETAMYFTYQFINPSTEIAKTLLLLGFWFLGGGLCVLFGFLGFAAWAAITKFALE